MVQKCVVLGCGSKWYPGCSLIFHSFPKDPVRRKQWLSIVKLKNTFYETAKICSNHFVASDYIMENRLKPTAIPFFPNQSDLKYDSSTVSVYYTPVTQYDNIIMPDMPSTSHFQLPDTYSVTMPDLSSGISNASIVTSNAPGVNDSPPSKRKCLREIIVGNNATEQIANENTPPAKPSCLDKSVQVKLISKQEEILKKRNKLLVQSCKRQKKTINNMKSLLATIRDYTRNSEIENIIKGNFANICDKFKKPSTNPHGVRYSDDVKAFALTLHFYSPKAYEILKKRISLPHVETLRRSLATFNCNVGFLTEVLDFLKQEVSKPEKFYLKNVALIFDGMSLKKDLSRDIKTDKIFGYVDLGQIPVTDPEQLASEALVFQIVSYGHYFKCPIAYFFIQNCLLGELLAELLHTAIKLLHDVGITVRSLTCDGAASNVKAYEHLGCSLDLNTWKTFFLHPNGNTNVYCLLDAAHMLKLARNVFADFIITTESGSTSFEYIRKLHEIQTKEGLKFANSLTATHVDFKNKKMNVKLAAQVICSSVADAIHFLKASGNSDFSDSGPTIEFLRIIDRIFDVMNSKSPFGTGYKSPLSLLNKCHWERIFNETESYLRVLSINGTNILKHRRKTFAIGFLMNITSLTLLVTDLCTLEVNPLKYLLTFKCSQDNLEIFFSCIRARGRAQDNPNPLEFRYIMRKLLFRNSIQPSMNANCIDYDFQTSHIMEFGNKHKSLLDSPMESQTDDIDIDTINKIFSTETSPYQENILFYITGYIIKQLLKNISCQHCQNSLITQDDPQKDHLYVLNINKFQSFTSFINRGKLHFPSVSAYTIVKYADKVFRHTVSLGKLNSNLIEKNMINIVQQHFSPLLTQMFFHPVPESIICFELHETVLLKKISSLFFKIRIKAYLKSVNELTLGDLRGERQKHHKTVLFSHI